MLVPFKSGVKYIQSVIDGEMARELLALNNNFPNPELLGVVVSARLSQLMLDGADLPALSY